MRCEFSETQFSFGYTFEILQKYSNLLNMPWFPNTVREGREGGGFDVEINFNVEGSLFLQFKIPTYIKKEDKYHVKIATNSNQFHLLKKLKLPANLVYYAMPKFYENSKMIEYYLAKEIEANSVLFSVDEFPTDAEYHRLKYLFSDSNNASYGILSSDPMNINAYSTILDMKYKRDIMSLFDKAEILFSKIKEVDPKITINYKDASMVKRVFTVLLFQYGILWIPILSQY